VVMTLARRTALLSGLVAVALGVSATPSRAALDMVVGARQIVKNAPLSDCNSKAKAALNAVLQDAAEVGSGDTGEWQAYGAPDQSGHPSSAAAVHCYPIDTGYVVTFTCAVQVPPNVDTASALCTKLATAFGGKATAFAAPRSAGGRSWH
jgi:hypothetical protein